MGFIYRHSSRLYKVIVIGEVATGKSALIKRYVHNHFSNRSDYRATVGVDFQLIREAITRCHILNLDPLSAVSFFLPPDIVIISAKQHQRFIQQQ